MNSFAFVFSLICIPFQIQVTSIIQMLPKCKKTWLRTKILQHPVLKYTAYMEITRATRLTGTYIHIYIFHPSIFLLFVTNCDQFPLI